MLVLLPVELREEYLIFLINHLRLCGEHKFLFGICFQRHFQHLLEHELWPRLGLWLRDKGCAWGLGVEDGGASA